LREGKAGTDRIRPIRFQSKPLSKPHTKSTIFSIPHPITPKMTRAAATAHQLIGLASGDFVFMLAPPSITGNRPQALAASSAQKRTGATRLPKLLSPWLSSTRAAPGLAGGCASGAGQEYLWRIILEVHLPLDCAIQIKGDAVNAHRPCPAIKPLGHCPGLHQVVAFHPCELATSGKLYDRVQRSVRYHVRHVLRIVVNHGRTRLTHVKASNSNTAMQTESRLNPPSQL
jgi:hypothetical protein